MALLAALVLRGLTGVHALLAMLLAVSSVLTRLGLMLAVASMRIGGRLGGGGSGDRRDEGGNDDLHVILLRKSWV